MTDQQVVDFMAVETHRNMLFLNAFLRQSPDGLSPSASSSLVPDWTLSQALVAFQEVKEVKAIDNSLRRVLNRLRQESRVEESLQFMLRCVSRSTLSNSMSDLYDAQYFYFTSGGSLRAAAASQVHQRVSSTLVGHTIAHIVDRHVAGLVREYECTKLLTEQFWIASITDHAHNPIMLGFLVEQAVLSYLSDDMVLRNLLHGIAAIPTDARPLVQLFDESSERSALRSEEAVVLYIPKSFNYPAIDAVLRIIEWTGLVVVAVPPKKKEKEPHKGAKPHHPSSPLQLQSKSPSHLYPSKSRWRLLMTLREENWFAFSMPGIDVSLII